MRKLFIVLALALMLPGCSWLRGLFSPRVEQKKFPDLPEMRATMTPEVRAVREAADNGSAQAAVLVEAVEDYRQAVDNATLPGKTPSCVERETVYQKGSNLAGLVYVNRMAWQLLCERVRALEVEKTKHDQEIRDREKRDAEMLQELEDAQRREREALDETAAQKRAEFWRLITFCGLGLAGGIVLWVALPQFWQMGLAVALGSCAMAGLYVGVEWCQENPVYVGIGIGVVVLAVVAVVAWKLGLIFKGAQTLVEVIEDKEPGAATPGSLKEAVAQKAGTALPAIRKGIAAVKSSLDLPTGDAK